MLQYLRFHSPVAEDSKSSWSDAMSFGEWFATFRSIFALSCSSVQQSKSILLNLHSRPKSWLKFCRRLFVSVSSLLYRSLRHIPAVTTTSPSSFLSVSFSWTLNFLTSCVLLTSRFALAADFKTCITPYYHSYVCARHYFHVHCRSYSSHVLRLNSPLPRFFIAECCVFIKGGK